MNLQEVTQHLSNMQAQQDQLQQKLTKLELQNAALRHQEQHRARKFIFRAVGVLTTCIVLLGTTNYLMAAPQPLVYSGYLEEKGSPIDGQRDMYVHIYTQATGGSPLCSVGDKSTNKPIRPTFVKGRFKADLSTCTANIDQTKSYWVEVEVKACTTLNPTTKQCQTFGSFQALGRTQLGAVPFAISALKCVRRELKIPKISSSYLDHFVKCQPGEIATGGGFVNIDTPAAIRRNGPLIDSAGKPIGWSCSAHLPTLKNVSSLTLECQVICCK